VCLTNLNRQIIATRKTVGKYKAEVMAERMLEINPQADIRVRKCFVLPENVDGFPFEEYDYVVDAIDTVSAKLCLVEQALAHDVPIISAMGAGNKLDPGRFHISDITKTHTCPLAPETWPEARQRKTRTPKAADPEPMAEESAQDAMETPQEPAEPMVEDSRKSRPENTTCTEFQHHPNGEIAPLSRRNSTTIAVK